MEQIGVQEGDPSVLMLSENEHTALFQTVYPCRFPIVGITDDNLWDCSARKLLNLKNESFGNTSIMSRLSRCCPSITDVFTQQQRQQLSSRYPQIVARKLFASYVSAGVLLRTTQVNNSCCRCS
jgi:hypothetical protein